MTDSNNSSPLVNSVIGYMSGIINAKGLTQYAAYAESVGLQADSFADGVST